MELCADASSLGQARDHIDRVGSIDRLQALPVGAARIVGVSIEVDREVADVCFHDVDGQADPQCHAQPNRIFVRFVRVAFGVNQDGSGHGGGQDHDRVLAEWEPPDHGSPVDPRIGHEQNAANRPYCKDRPVPSAIDLGDKDLREQDK